MMVVPFCLWGQHRVTATDDLSSHITFLVFNPQTQETSIRSTRVGNEDVFAAPVSRSPFLCWLRRVPDGTVLLCMRKTLFRVFNLTTFRGFLGLSICLTRFYVNALPSLMADRPSLVLLYILSSFSFLCSRAA